ncbi:hypothetical protein LZQ00_14885 [Sphingobacterium sp. SRCM116780]|uniref:hypothetical protein n=1 Tax=Sphingobacterium sp. SRCM116780 TaxID=2907623 RepID=UPI001F3DD5E7|nr:hypothetical protein [Sphingobacterium sp. SRCM116780]UIR55543.1 hypothetical protein LZQ00_14885 [Sphingobacterium sp. SRCM116780]
MEKLSFKISTLHRGRYMLLLLLFVLTLVYIVTRLPLSEVVKIMIALFSLPLVLFIAVKCAKKTSVWTIENNQLTMENSSFSKTIPLTDIDYVRNLRRSGGNLIIIKLKQKGNIRAWRNKLFEAEDDLKSFCESLKDQKIEYYDM